MWLGVFTDSHVTRGESMRYGKPKREPSDTGLGGNWGLSSASMVLKQHEVCSPDLIAKESVGFVIPPTL